MELRDVLNQMIDENRSASQPSELKIGTVTSEDPLEITINTAMAPLRAGVLILTEPVIEKKIPILQHTHGGQVQADLLQSSIICQENSEGLPVEGGYIILNEGLKSGDKVVLMRVQNGQKFIVLSRAYGG